MNIAIVSCVYPPEPAVSGRTSADVADALAGEGHDVTVIAPFPSRPSGRLHAGYRRSWREASLANRVRLLRCFSTMSRRSTLPSRLLENVSFGITSALALATIPRPDVALLNTWPLIATGLCTAVARIRRVPILLSVQDMYPESLVVQGRIARRGLVARLLLMLDRTVARTAGHILVLTEQWKAVYRDTRGIPGERIHVIPNWIDGDPGVPSREECGRWRESHGIERGVRLIAYGGNIGAAADVEGLIRAYSSLEFRDVQLLVAGDGPNVRACEEAARGLAPGRVVFHRPWKTEETAVLLGAADLLVLPTRGMQSTVSVPSKLLSYLLAGRPIVALAASDSELATILTRSGAGWVAPPDDLESFMAKVKVALELPPAQLDSMGQAGRRYSLEHFERSAALRRVVALLKGAA